MYLNRFKFISLPSKQAGIGLPATIFIITIMSLIAVAVNRLNDVSAMSFSQNVLSARAFYAAESGAQLRASTVLTGPPCSCGANPSVQFSFNVPGLSLCQADTVCNSFDANGETYCTVVSTGQCDGGNSQRSIEVRLK